MEPSKSFRAAVSIVARDDKGRLSGRVGKRIATGDAGVAEAFACSRLMVAVRECGNGCCCMFHGQITDKTAEGCWKCKPITDDILFF